VSLYAREDFREGPLGVETSDGARGKIGHGGSVSSSGVRFLTLSFIACVVSSSLLSIVCFYHHHICALTALLHFPLLPHSPRHLEVHSSFPVLLLSSSSCLPAFVIG